MVPVPREVPGSAFVRLARERRSGFGHKYVPGTLRPMVRFGRIEKPDGRACRASTFCPWLRVWEGKTSSRAPTGNAQARGRCGFQSRPPFAVGSGSRAVVATLYFDSLKPPRRWVGLCVRTCRPRRPALHRTARRQPPAEIATPLERRLLHLRVKGRTPCVGSPLLPCSR